MVKEILINCLTPLDNYIFGTADLTGIIDQKFGEYRFGITIGRRLDDTIIDGINKGPTLEYYNHYNQINFELASLAGKIKNELQKVNIDSIIIDPTNANNSNGLAVYIRTLTVDISHKMVATRAGLGWIGKTDLFISKEFGPRLRLVSLLINRRPEIDLIPITSSRCGNCCICVDLCPAKAANGKLWNVKVYRDEFFDAHKCRDKCGELTKQKLKVDKRLCGLCVSICPIGKRKEGN